MDWTELTKGTLFHKGAGFVAIASVKSKLVTIRAQLEIILGLMLQAFAVDAYHQVDNSLLIRAFLFDVSFHSCHFRHSTTSGGQMIAYWS